MSLADNDHTDPSQRTREEENSDPEEDLMEVETEWEVEAMDLDGGGEEPTDPESQSDGKAQQTGIRVTPEARGREASLAGS